ncbi:TPR repeat-containing protein [Gloeothece citriformis PCC 7424]|uniref:TPR repeat-containing protein n=1 Tax=Gloeothece citriformis (strain PCC 7424) TaxID=65393 RepID=B7K6Y1_GLOC7|nr:tetratricopeptide repeat protein [Gloeothece citriformis]ACK72680.1 TPR repeat-containing protein [Gloeothece citriformis PCC 7424]
MTSFSRKELPIYSLLSLGQRGVGKTVFLAGSYASLKTPHSKNESSSFWIECLEQKDQTSLEAILGYIAQHGNYPPPTMKITDFDFIVKQKTRLGAVKPVCQFRWWDIPGEYTTFDNPDFQQMVLESHSCCVFINAFRLLHDPSYREEFQGIIKQVFAIASLVNPAEIQYSFALIFTQCDRLDGGPILRLQIEQYLQPLNKVLESVQAHYKQFYSGIPIVSEQGMAQLQPNNTSEVFLWLVTELVESKANKSLEQALKPDIKTPQRLSSSANRSIVTVIAASLGLLALTTGLLFAFGVLTPAEQQSQVSDPDIKRYVEALNKNPDDFDTLVALGNRYLQLGELQQATTILEKIVQQKPQELNWKFNLAQLYELTENNPKAEGIYDKIIAQDQKNFKALVNKALLRREAGDHQTAQQLFKQAEKVAPSEDLKQKVQDISINRQ